MKEKYLIVKEPTLFTGDGYILSYRLMICHAIFIFLQSKKNASLKSIEEILDKICSAFNSYNPFYQPGFMEVYPFILGHAYDEEGEHYGIVVIDRTGGCFPLVLYPDDSEPNHGDRICAFRLGLEEIRKGIISKFAFIKEKADVGGSWNDDLVKTLLAQFQKVN